MNASASASTPAGGTGTGTAGASGATLTDRYVWAVVRALPESQRADVDRELRASITDALEARLEGGEDASQAERDILGDLGEPARLAARYADRPLHLVGPEYYLAWKQLLILLLAIVVPIAAVASATIQALTGATFGGVIGSAIGLAISAGVHVAFWTTLACVIVERTRTERSPLVPFSLDALPQPPRAGQPGLAGFVCTTVLLAAWIAALVGQQFWPFVTDTSGETIPVLAPALWPLWVGVFVLLALLEIVWAYALWSTGRYTRMLFLTSAALSVAFAVIASILLTQDVINPEFARAVGIAEWTGRGKVVNIVVAIAVGALAAWNIVDVWMRYSASRTQP
jgi:hypothetical protein